MYESDYILRVINLMGIAFRRMLDAIAEQRSDDALEVARQAMEELMGASAGALDRLSGEGLLTLLSAGGELDVFHGRLLAELLLHRALAYEEGGAPERAAAERERAQVLFTALPPEDPDDDSQGGTTR